MFLRKGTMDGVNIIVSVGKLGLVAAVVVRTQVEEAVGWYC